MNSRKTGGILSAGILLIVYGFYQSYQKDKHEAVMRQSYQFNQRIKAHEDSIRNYNIDSFCNALKEDKYQHITHIKYTPADSGIFMIAKPEFDYTNRQIADSLYTIWYSAHQFKYAKNISAITISAPFNAKEAANPNFTPPLIWFAAKPGSQIYNEWKALYPQQFK